MPKKPSKFAHLPSRRYRRDIARKVPIEPPFTPQYNGPVPKSYAKMYGVGYERFDGKYVTVSDKVDAKGGE